VITTLCLLAFRETHLKPQTRVGEVLAEADGRPAADLTIHQLLVHTSGLPAWRPVYALAAGDPERALPALLAVDLERSPGESVMYSCLGFQMLGFILTRVLGAPLERSFTDRVLEPLGLTHGLGFRPDPATRPVVPGACCPSVEERLTAEEGLDPDHVPALAEDLPDDGNARFLAGVAGNAGLFGTAHGVLSLASQFLRGPGRLLSVRESGLSTRCHTPGQEQARGFGWQLAATSGCSAGPALPQEAFGHTGFTGPSVWVDPSSSTVLVLLAHRHHPVHREVDMHPLRRRFHSLVMEGLGG
jgi:CubicO group peptidase (beta-lactamase class C family)